MRRDSLPDKYKELAILVCKDLADKIRMSILDSTMLENCIYTSSSGVVLDGKDDLDKVRLKKDKGGYYDTPLTNMDTAMFRVDKDTTNQSYLKNCFFKMADIAISQMVNCILNIEAQTNKKHVLVFVMPLVQYGYDKQAEYFGYRIPGTLVLKDKTLLLEKNIAAKEKENDTEV